MATEQKGVIYYKLDPDYHFKGDYTKNCGLNGTEIDSNFHFLRGYDISSFAVSENKEELVITRLNGEKLTVNVREEFNGYDFSYNEVEGILSITAPYGEKIDLEGFLTRKSFRVYGDATMNGDGTRYNPMSISSNARTGTFRPVKTLLNVCDGDKLPTENISKNDRYVTKENINTFGLLYPLTGVQKIQKRLEEIGSEWRVPTKADWDQMLNVIEDCPEDRNHDDEPALTNVYLGKNAGAYLKTNTWWEPQYELIDDGAVILNDELRYTLDADGNYVQDYQGEYLKVIQSEDKYGFNVIPVGFGGRRGRASIGGFGEWAAYWTSTEEDGHQDMYVKVFSDVERGVEQNTWGRDCYLSLRLVKDFNGENLNEVEMIDGVTVATKHFDILDASDKEKYTNTLIWTSENIAFVNEEYGGVASKEWEGKSKDVPRYYINDWDGERWVKNELKEGESVVILSLNGVEMHEWRLIDGVLVDTLEMLRKEIQKDFDVVHNRIDAVESALATEAEIRKAKDEELHQMIVGEIMQRQEDVERLKEAITLETEQRENADALLSKEIETEANLRAEADQKLQEQIEDLVQVDVELGEKIAEETANRVEADEKIKELIEDEMKARVEADVLLNQMIAEEAAIREKADAELQVNLNKEAEARENADIELQKNIDEEAEARGNADVELQKNIDINKVIVENEKSGIVVTEGFVDAEGNVQNTTVRVKLPEIGRIKVDEFGLYFDGNFNEGFDTVINNQ